TAESRAAFFRAATDIVERLSVPGHDADDTWVNILNARDGAWGIAGRALTNADLAAAIAAGV
ncbi:hypothetical protein, partial [Kitasatospora sp. NPDC093558]|uniref:tautomerase family protein n=1 Tax=Kitasatospora sp. NPDC093558 TaxID=3155201 RepID=UPI003423543B